MSALWFAVPAPAPDVHELRDVSVVPVAVSNRDGQRRKLAPDALRDFIKDERWPNSYVGQPLLHSLESVKRGICQVQGQRDGAETLLRAFIKPLPAPDPPRS